MKLLTCEILKQLPPLRSTSEKDPSEIPIIVKYFCPWNQWTWYVTEGEAELDINELPTGDFTMYGFVVGDFKEQGYFMLNELQEIVGPGGLRIERDLHFGNVTLEDVIQGRKR